MLSILFLPSNVIQISKFQQFAKFSLKINVRVKFFRCALSHQSIAQFPVPSQTLFLFWTSHSGSCFTWPSIDRKSSHSFRLCFVPLLSCNFLYTPFFVFYFISFVFIPFTWFLFFDDNRLSEILFGVQSAETFLSNFPYLF